MQLIGDEHVPMPVLVPYELHVSRYWVENQALCLVCHGLTLSGSFVHKI